MRFKALIAGEEHSFEVVRQGQQLRVRVDDGEPQLLEVVRQEADGFVLRREDGRLLHVAGHKAGSKRQIWVEGRTLSYERVEKRAAGAAAASGSLSSNIPAVVSEVLVAEGDVVKLGDKLILLESMKMVIPISAPHDGVVAAIHCAKGESIAPGVPLIEVE